MKRHPLFCTAFVIGWSGQAMPNPVLKVSNGINEQQTLISGPAKNSGRSLRQAAGKYDVQFAIPVGRRVRATEPCAWDPGDGPTLGLAAPAWCRSSTCSPAFIIPSEAADAILTTDRREVAAALERRGSVLAYL